jgi:hypothetical protein
MQQMQPFVTNLLPQCLTDSSEDSLSLNSDTGAELWSQIVICETK